LRTEAGQPLEDFDPAGGDMMQEYIDWRIKHPSDDLMTELLHAEFTDETGTSRRLTREEVIIFCNVLAGAGNETTNRLIGWTGKLLAEHPEQRRQLAGDHSLIPNAIEEILRYEPPGPHIGRYVTRDTEFHGRKVPQGSIMLFLVGAANRDHRRFPDGDRFDIGREKRPNLSFGWGIHTCIGAALTRVEGRVALEEVLKRFPEWDVEWDKAKLSPTSTVRGWETLPVVTR
jgi:cytochrome P450